MLSAQELKQLRITKLVDMMKLCLESSFYGPKKPVKQGGRAHTSDLVLHVVHQSLLFLSQTPQNQPTLQFMFVPSISIKLQQHQYPMFKTRVIDI